MRGIGGTIREGMPPVLRSIVGALTLAVMLVASTGAQAQFGPPELIEAAKKEGALVLYTANVAEVEQLVIQAFNKRFPFIKVELLRAPGGQLITRVKTEAAAGKLRADVIDHSERRSRSSSHPKARR